MKLNLVGDVISSTGYGNHARQLAFALEDENVDLAVEGARPQAYNQLQTELGRNMTQRLKKTLDKNVHAHEETPAVIISLPPHFTPYYGLRIPKLLGYVIFEGTNIPTGWITVLEDKRLHEIIVPSTHVKRAIPQHISKVRIVPHGVNTSLFNPRGPRLPTPNNKYRFLFVGGWKDGVLDRKGLDFALRAFCDEFNANEDVEFVVKYNPLYGGDVINNINSLNLSKRGERPNINLIKELLPYSDMPSLYRINGCLVNPAKDEAFGLHMVEALACGMPVIATRGIGVLSDYTIPGVYDVNVEGLVPATGERHIYENALWKVPSINHLRKQMRYVYEHQSSARENALKGSAFVQRELTWQETARKIKKLIQ